MFHRSRNTNRRESIVHHPIFTNTNAVASRVNRLVITTPDKRMSVIECNRKPTPSLNQDSSTPLASSSCSSLVLCFLCSWNDHYLHGQRLKKKKHDEISYLQTKNIFMLNFTSTIFCHFF